ncbi:PspC domain-containing protein [Nocardia sp. NPDC005746]|uniref:PspC domain-containing protein n=1 Tax=Nocardia sp. NPDC005746 TaxID=3157062 RepID=UPI00340A4F50
MTRTSDWSKGAGRTGFSDQIQDLWQTRPVRFPKDGPIAGVAVGFGRRYNVDPVLVRVAFVVSALFGGAGVVLYLLGWLLLNQAGDQSSAAESLFGRGQASQPSSKTIVLMVALGIAVSTMGPVGVGLGGSGVISFALMLGGWWLLYQRQTQPPAGHFEQSAVTDPFNTGYPGTASPYWTGYPGTNAVTFQTYGPYTTLPDHYEPDPNQPPAAAPEPEPVDTQKIPNTEQVTEVLETRYAPASSVSDTVVLRKSESASGPGTPEQPDEPADTPATAVDLTKPKTGGDDGGAPETPSTPPSDVEPPTLHRIPPATDRPRAGFGPAPISPDFGPTPPGWDPLGVAPLAWQLPEPAAPVQQQVVQAPPARPRSRLTPVTIGLAILAAAAAGSMAAAGVEWMTPGRIGAAALAVVAVGLIVGAFLRRGYGLMVVLAPLAGFVILASLIGPIQFDEGAMGDHKWSAATDSELLPVYHISMGSGTLDLSQLKLTEDRAVEVKVRMGDARVMLPPNLRVNTTCNVRMGDSNCPSGISGPATGPVLNLTVDVQMGNAEVNRG